jgi:signal transduction histidine kinase
VTVESERHGADLLIRVTDKGKGYDPGMVIARPQRGLGLISIRERLSLIGGIVEIQTALGAGTRSVLKAPLANDVSEVTPELKP